MAREMMDVLYDKVSEGLNYIDEETFRYLQMAFELEGTNLDYPFIVDEEDRGLMISKITGQVYTFKTELDSQGNHKFKGMMTVYTNKDSSSKQDGYLVCIYRIKNVDGTYRNYYLRQHILVAMMTNPEGYEYLKECGCKKVVVCHKDNCTFHNTPENLEWGTQRDNTIHAKFVYSIDKYLKDAYTHIERNETCGFLVLNEGINNSEIKEFIDTHCIDVPKREELFDYSDTMMFINFMVDKKYWSSRQEVIEC